MRRVLAELTRNRIQVKPVTPASGLFGWTVVQGNLAEQFVDDRRRFGFWIAIGNALVELGLLPISGSEQERHEN